MIPQHKVWFGVTGRTGSRGRCGYEGGDSDVGRKRGQGFIEKPVDFHGGDEEKDGIPSFMAPDTVVVASF